MKKIFLLLMFLPLCTFAQQKLIDVQGWNCYVYAPDNLSKSYPAIVFIPGIGEVGADANKVIANGPGAYIKSGWDGSVNGVQFIVFSLQPPKAWPSVEDIHARITELRKRYPISDLTVSGLSMGGWAAQSYALFYPGEVQRIVGVESVVRVNGPETDSKSYEDSYRPFATQGGKMLLFEQANDYRRNDMVAAGMNANVKGSAIYIHTSFGGGGHCCWSEFYGGGGKQPGRFAEINNETLYEWIADDLTVLANFITNAFLQNGTISWSCDTQAGDYFLIEESTDGVHFNEIGCVDANNSKTYKYSA